MSDTPSLYDRHAATLYALALRITGDAARAADVLEDVFVAAAAGEVTERELLRATRDRALARHARTAPAPVLSGGTPTPRQLVEAVFYGGMSVGAVARAYGMDDATTRQQLRAGMAELRSRVARGATR